MDYYTFEKEVDQFLGRISALDLKYALSGLAAAWLVAPYVRPVDVHLYIPSENMAAILAEKLELNPTPRSGNVKFVVPYDEGVFYGVHEVKGVKVVSNVQLYVDLYNFPARGEEAASQLLEVMLKEWHQKKEVTSKCMIGPLLRLLKVLWLSCAELFASIEMIWFLLAVGHRTFW